MGLTDGARTVVAAEAWHARTLYILVATRTRAALTRSCGRGQPGLRRPPHKEQLGHNHWFLYFPFLTVPIPTHTLSYFKKMVCNSTGVLSRKHS